MKKKSISTEDQARATRAKRKEAQREANQQFYRNQVASERLQLMQQSEEALQKARLADAAQIIQQEQPHLHGQRPTEFTPQIAELVLRAVSTSTASLARICEFEGLPEPATVLRWARTNEDFGRQYKIAKEDQADMLAEGCLEIADTPQIGEKIKYTPMGVEVSRADMIEHRRLRIETRKWLAAALNKRYSTRVLELEGGKDIGANAAAALQTTQNIVQLFDQALSPVQSSMEYQRLMHQPAPAEPARLAGPVEGELV